MKKVLVTGVSGFVGQHCAVELLKNGYAVKGSVRSLSRTEEVINGIKKEVVVIDDGSGDETLSILKANEFLYDIY